MKNIGFLAYPDMQSLDLMGPLDVFGTVNSAMPGKAPYRLHVVGLDANPVCAENRLFVTPTCTLDDAPAFDTLLIPGGLGSRRFDTHTRLLDWLRDHAAATMLNTACRRRPFLHWSTCPARRTAYSSRRDGS